MTIVKSTGPALCAALAAVLILACPVAAAAAGTQPPLGLTTTGQPTEVTLTGADASVPGFRSATWGMTPDEVRGALAKDFGGAKAGAPIADPVAGTTALIAPMASLAPGPGPAAITYIFGRSGRLIHVNLDWTVKAATPAARSAILDGGAKVVAGFLGNYWKLGSVMRGVVVEPALIVLFAGADEQGGGVDVRVGGVPYAMHANGVLQTITPPPGAATLHVGFSAPDAAKATSSIAPGAF